MNDHWERNPYETRADRARTGDAVAKGSLMQWLHQWTGRVLAKAGCADPALQVDFLEHMFRDGLRHLPERLDGESYLRIALQHFVIDRMRRERRVNAHEMPMSQLDEADADRIGAQPDPSCDTLDHVLGW